MNAPHRQHKCDGTKPQSDNRPRTQQARPRDDKQTLSIYHNGHDTHRNQLLPQIEHNLQRNSPSTTPKSTTKRTRAGNREAWTNADARRPHKGAGRSKDGRSAPKETTHQRRRRRPISEDTSTSMLGKAHRHGKEATKEPNRTVKGGHEPTHPTRLHVTQHTDSHNTQDAATH
jgi:hypothetical protein